MSKSHTRQMADAAEQSIRGLIKAFGPKMFATGLNNACCHGEVFTEMDLNVTDEALGKWFDGIGMLSTAATELLE